MLHTSIEPDNELEGACINREKVNITYYHLNFENVAE